ncbi:hypothetical protein AVEN_198949-1 [Araneus ventricosus]|uniref:Uncharacterized protein n=1 Tax=Araneus ventricosus TaxID=182803 RepID=A0A4Y2P652_ARAVE|nr:hypothetical protein AVEN_198949-1 [Araneus ventricosus]
MCSVDTEIYRCITKEYAPTYNHLSILSSDMISAAFRKHIYITPTYVAQKRGATYSRYATNEEWDKKSYCFPGATYSRYATNEEWDKKSYCFPGATYSRYATDDRWDKNYIVFSCHSSRYATDDEWDKENHIVFQRHTAHH